MSESFFMQVKSLINLLLYLFKTWITVLPRIVYRCSVSLLIDPKGAQRFIHHVLSAQDLQVDDSILNSVELTDLLGDKITDIQIVTSSHKSYSSETRILKELMVLGYMMKVIKPRRVFEVGTFIGRTTRLLALNSPSDCEIFTLDLSKDKVSHQIGEEYHNTPENRKITQLYGDSREFDFANWYGKCDFIWVDGCHDVECVMSDTENALKLRSSKGWIAWHDYRHTAWWSGITKSVRMTHKSHPNLVHIRGITIALLPGK
ncbi:MAG TPA: class I SAM-dependent methyltransferase [bacterium]|nr:class I SAM-dependent methyltransferase [bacterium]